MTMTLERIEAIEHFNEGHDLITDADWSLIWEHHDKNGNLNSHSIMELCALAKEALAKRPRPISEADKATTIQALTGAVWQQAKWDDERESWVDERHRWISPAHFVVLGTP